MIGLVKFLLRIIVSVLIAIPLLLYPFLYFFQEKLLFPLTGVSPKVLQWARQTWPDSEVMITAPDGVLLHGWYLQPNQPRDKFPLLIYFGGNAEDITSFLIYKDYFFNWGILTINYRGYGLSEGKPTEPQLFADALFLYDRFAKQPEIDSRYIVVVGRSLGSGVAVYLASQRQLAGVILVSPYDSITAIAQEVYPYVPVSWLLKHPFNSLALAPQINTPVLGLIADNDTLIAPQHSKKLLSAWKGPADWVLIPNTNHIDITEGKYYWESIQEFLAQVLLRH